MHFLHSIKLLFYGICRLSIVFCSQNKDLTGILSVVKNQAAHFSFSFFHVYMYTTYCLCVVFFLFLRLLSSHFQCRDSLWRHTNMKKWFNDFSKHITVGIFFDLFSVLAFQMTYLFLGFYVQLYIFFAVCAPRSNFNSHYAVLYSVFSVFMKCHCKFQECVLFSYPFLFNDNDVNGFR